MTSAAFSIFLRPVIAAVAGITSVLLLVWADYPQFERLATRHQTNEVSLWARTINTHM